ncbi:MAG: RidA family protein [Firmicutes bacterium]|nr:RidA family protein [Bacillota bacterium]MBR0104100.1 RidA family protein [Bacillota bacterium]
MFEIRQTDKAPAAIGPYSQSVLYGDLLFTSGQIAIIPETGEMEQGSIEAQADRVMKNLSAVLAEYGAGFENVIKTTCFLADMDDFAVFNEVYGRYFSNHKPARSCVAVKALPKGALCEVEIIAAIK